MSGAHEITEPCPQCWHPTPVSLLVDGDRCPDCNTRFALARWSAAEKLPAKSAEVREAREAVRRALWPSVTD